MHDIVRYRDAISAVAKRHSWTLPDGFDCRLAPMGEHRDKRAAFRAATLMTLVNFGLSHKDAADTMGIGQGSVAAIGRQILPREGRVWFTQFRAELTAALRTEGIFPPREFETKAKPKSKAGDPAILPGFGPVWQRRMASGFSSAHLPERPIR